MKVLKTILKILGIIIKVITWIIVNGVPFFRGIWEEIKNASAKKRARS